jgi:hypothetical protein
VGRGVESPVESRVGRTIRVRGTEKGTVFGRRLVVVARQPSPPRRLGTGTSRSWWKGRVKEDAMPIAIRETEQKKGRVERETWIR